MPARACTSAGRETFMDPAEWFSANSSNAKNRERASEQTRALSYRAPFQINSTRKRARARARLRAMIIRDTYYSRSENINFRDQRGRNNPCYASERGRDRETESQRGTEGQGEESKGRGQYDIAGNNGLSVTAELIRARSDR